MKKVFAILILLTLAVLAVFPMAAFAEENSGSTNTDTTNLRLVNPVAICAVDNKLFIADNITENNSIVLCFDIANTPKYLFSTSVAKSIVNLSESNGKLVVVYADGVDKYEISDDKLTLNNEGSQIANVAGIVDVTYGYVTWDNKTPAEYYVNNGSICFYAAGSVFSKYDVAPNALACLEFDGHVYFLCESDNGIVCKRFAESASYYNSDDAFNTNTTLELVPKGILTCNVGDESKLVLYSDKSFCYMTNKNDNSAFYFESDKLLFNYSELTKQQNNVIVDACSNGSKVFVLNDKNEVEIFSQTQTDDGWKFESETATIGTDTITLDILPQVESFNSYTLAKSKGYPTNIVYKTSDDDTSIQEVITNQTESFIILGFDGCEELSFYYVLVGNRFGWVKKSDGVSTASEDVNITIIDTKLIDETYTYNAKFLSPGEVFIFKLPITHLPNESDTVSPIKDSFTQTLNTMQDVRILQKFTENNSVGTVVEWYFVEYGDGKNGFIQCGNVGKFYISSQEEGIPYLDDMKINASLFEGVKIYRYATMTEEDESFDANGNVLKLRSGASVKAIEKNKAGTAMYVEVTQDGHVYYGWIPIENVIDRHNITTNAAVGLCILAAASFCALVLLLLFKYRNKKNEFEEE